MKLKQYAALGLAMIAPLGLSGCLILPGEFTSDMTVLKSGEFTFSYKGQIQLLGLANLLNDTIEAGMETGEFEASCWGKPPEEKAEEEKTEKEKEKTAAKKEKAIEQSRENAASLERIKIASKGTAASSTAQEDYDIDDDAEPAKADDMDAEDAAEAEEAAVEAAEAAAEAISEAADDFEERECTAEEIADQKAEWDELQVTKKKQEEEQKQIFKMLLGGIDPKDPETIKRFTKEVERLAAWNKVEHLGDGLFMIDYSTKGTLADDFAFPVIPRYALGQPMIHITRWDNGRLRVEAPSFHSDPDFSAMAMMGGGAMMGMAQGKTPTLKPVTIKGTFTLTTDARILANNTEEGPEENGNMKKLLWEVGPDIFGPPMALLKLN